MLVQRHGNACTGLISKMTEHGYCTVSVAQNSLHHIRHPQLSQIGIGLPVTIHQPFTSRHVQTITNLAAAHENDGLSRNVGHGKRSTDLEHRSARAVSQSACGATHLVVDSVPLGNQHAVNATALARRGAREITQCAVELGQLIHSFVAYQGFSDKEDLVWVVDGDEL